jgi:hypothetical protein
MKRFILLLGFLFVISILPLLAKESNISEPKYQAIENRLLAIEKRLDVLEQRVDLLEKFQRPIPKFLKDPDKLNKQIQEARNAIELAKKQIEALPWPDKPEDKLEALNERWKLLSSQEINYLKIIRIAERNPDLGVDVTNEKKGLIECQGNKERIELEKQHLQETIEDSKEESSTKNPTQEEIVQ